nr:Chain E, Large delta antigen [Hepatitis delta virus]5M5V_F Chain F, Large delta antigen [Hepatitis delta virus]5M5V_G Chain G, Large delta antigen [Hepatitis delta virus]5M5V_H Chain H, Large delta antigen [Hepatitis delta virus]5M5V_I Chain I, Large delta antigen [Hepatitis delta virus]5M5V_J Chain J, Large delta antigen [Hepatitis delta virus]
SPRLPLLES